MRHGNADPQVKSPAASWQTKQERGNAFVLRLMAWIGLRLGRPVARAILYPVCAYFILFSRGARAASRAYLTAALGRPPTLADIFRQHFWFAATLLDRVYVFAGQHERFDIEVHGERALQDHLATGKGILLLGAHMGNHTVARAAGRAQANVTVNLMMYEDNARTIRQVEEALGANESPRVIPLGSVDALLKARDCLARGECVGMLADRVLHDDRIVAVPFFGRPAHFPAGPILTAALLRVPVMLFFSLYRGGKRYTLHFENFADIVELSRDNRTHDVERYVARFAARLEHYCRLAPYNWFNFFDYWKAAAEHADAATQQPPRSGTHA